MDRAIGVWAWILYALKINSFIAIAWSHIKYIHVYVPVTSKEQMIFHIQENQSYCFAAEF